MKSSHLLRSVGLVLAISAAGCASVRQEMGQTFDGWLGTEGKAETFYAASAVAVYAEANKSAKVVGRLAAREKVGRTKVDRGYAYVITDRGLEGWVDNAQLLWRLPPSSTVKFKEVGPAATPAPDPARGPAPAPEPIPAATLPDAPEVAATPAPPAPAATALPAPNPTSPIVEPTPPPRRSKAAPAIFDPF